MSNQRWSLSLSVSFVLASLAAMPIAQAQPDVSKYITSREKIGGETDFAATQTYRKKWALIIGVDYAEGSAIESADRRVIPQLANARRDAKALSQKLLEKYGYSDENVVLLLETDATRDRISRELERLHGSDVGANDSVLVFFAGHGAKQDDVNGNVVIYPHDVELHDGHATSGMIFVRDELISKLEKSKARHKLLILDSCYSGEVFSQKLELQANPDSQSGSDRSLFSQRGFQVIASCRGYQKASDGTGGVHSPFALALLRGLEEIPSNEKEPPRIWTGRLMSTLDEEFRVLPDGQRPSHRSLAGSQGEFTFFPDFEHAKFGDQTHGPLLSFAMLKATSPGVKGNWWFDEMPWFIPSVRGRILMQNHVLSRSSDYSASIEPGKLRDIAVKVRDRMRVDAARLVKTNSNLPELSPEAVNESKLLQLREMHLTRLLQETDPAARLKTLEGIETDLLSTENAKLLEAPDLHLLAVIQHSLGRATALEKYEEAVNAYSRPSQSDDHNDKLQVALKALCHADFGDGLQDLGNKPTEAIEQFNFALQAVGPSRPVAFEVYCMCRLAEIYLQDNRWEDAKTQLRKAEESVNKFDSRSHLAAFVHRSTAWSEMIQWQVADAESSFRQSNDLLLPLILEKSTPESRQIEQDELIGQYSVAFRKSPDFGAKVAYFHNLHGLAMSLRYRGKVPQAAQQYREVINMIEDALFQIPHVPDNPSTRTETESSLLLRFVNSQERLGDCNLLDDPSTRDLGEAADDYRRALSRVHRLPSTKRIDLRAQLLYKQSLAFALPSPTQDTGLALQMCRQADEILDEDGRTSTALLLALRTLTTPMVNMLSSVADLHPKATDDTSAAAGLRSAIHELRDVAGASAHRDQLELMLFATRNLIEYGQESSRLKQTEDVELLLSLNRMALNRNDAESKSGISLGSQSFLRQYYDTAFLASLDSTPKDAKRLLEIQHEATTGTRYGKSDVFQNRVGNQPVLAVYQARQIPYLICDCPRSQGICTALNDICTTAELAAACNEKSGIRMRLPMKVVEMVNGFFERQVNEDCFCRFAYHDPIHSFGFSLAEVSVATVADTGERHSRSQARQAPEVTFVFPFQVPDHWTEPPSIPQLAR